MTVWGFVMQDYTMDVCDGVYDDSFAKKAKLLESKLAPTILSRQAIHAAKMHYRTYVCHVSMFLSY